MSRRTWVVAGMLAFTVAAGGTTAPLPEPVVAADDDFVYVAGVLGNRPGSEEFPDGVAAQTRQALENLRAILAEEGLDLGRVASVNVFLTDTRYFPAMNEVYRTFFPDAPPTRATVKADLMERDAQIQIAAVAVKRHLDRTVVAPAGLQRPNLPYSWGIRAGNTLFVAGATSRNPSTYEPVPGDITAQTEQVLRNIGAVLEAGGMSYRDVTACKVFLDDPRDFGAMNGAYGAVFNESPPGRATVSAGLMNPVFLVEIQCVAAQGPDRSVVRAEGARPSRAPLSPGIRVGDRVYLSGMLGRGPDGYEPDAGVQTRRTLDNLLAALQGADMSFDHVVDAIAFVPDVRRAGAVVEAYNETMPAGAPRLTVVGAGLVSTDAMVEIMMTAVR